MPEQDIQTRLNRLNHSPRPENFAQRQVEIVYWYCKLGPGDNEKRLRQNIAFRMDSNSDTLVYNQRYSIERSLEIENIRHIPAEVCDVLVRQIEALPTISREVSELRLDPHRKEEEVQITLDVPDFSKLAWPVVGSAATDNSQSGELAAQFFGQSQAQQPDAIDEALQRQEGEQPASVIGNERGNRPTQQTSSDSAPPNWPGWLLLIFPILLLCGLSLLGLNWLRDRNPLPEEMMATVVVAVEETVNALPAFEVTRIITELVEVTVPPDPSQLAAFVESTVSAWPTLTPLLVTVPVYETVQVTSIATVEVPVTVEVTPVPTATPTPTPLPQTVTITEDFDDGEIDPAFTVLGNPTIVNGILYPQDGSMTLSIGDESWKDYVIQYTYTAPCSGNHRDQFLRVRIQGANDYLAHIYTCGGGGWYVLTGGNEFPVPGSDVRSQGQMMVQVEGDKILHTFPNGSVYELINSNFDSGSISLTVGRGTIDNLVITRND